MESVHLFSLTARHNQYLAARQTTIAGNIANASTPGFKSLDLEPFDAAIEQSRLSMAATNASHLAPGNAVSPDAQVTEGAPWEVLPSGNSVSIEQELLKSNETKGAFALNTNVMRSFHKMLLAAAKG